MWPCALHRLAQSADFGRAEVLVPWGPRHFFWWTWGEESMKRRYLLKGACCVCLINGHKKPGSKKGLQCGSISLQLLQMATEYIHDAGGWVDEGMPSKTSSWRACQLQKIPQLYTATASPSLWRVCFWLLYYLASTCSFSWNLVTGQYLVNQIKLVLTGGSVSRNAPVRTGCHLADTKEDITNPNHESTTN